jgi:hypothetical protein
MARLSFLPAPSVLHIAEAEPSSIHRPNSNSSLTPVASGVHVAKLALLV